MNIESSRGRKRLPAQILLAMAVLLVPQALSGQTGRPLPNQDFQGWTDFDATHPLRENTDFHLSTGLRYGDDQGHLMYRRIATGVVFHWHKFLTLEPYYQHSVSDLISGSISYENRLAMAATVEVPWKRWEISDHNVGERRFLQNQRLWRYRNRVEVRRPTRIVRKQLSVFAWDEIYYSPSIHSWYLNRVALGAGRKLGRRISTDIYYVHQSSGYAHPGNLNALGLTIKARF